MNAPDLPAPLVPACVDLRDFPKMPLYVHRLRKSETRLRTRPEEFRAAVMLWCAAWHDVPAASLPNDDLVLADLAGYGNQVKAWKKVKPGALRGFVLCSDGRLYHEVVSEVAIESWGAQLKQRHRNACDRIKKHNQRTKEGLPLPPFVLWITENCPEGLPYMSRWTRDHVPVDTPSVSPGQVPVVPGEKLSKGREGIGLPVSTTVSRNDSEPPRAVDNPRPEAARSNPRAVGSWRSNPDAAQRKLVALGVSATWSTGKTHGECVARIEQELKGQRVKGEGEQGARAA